MNGRLVISCEHGGNRIPAAYRRWFDSAQLRALLQTHRGFDAGALLMAKELAARFAAPLVGATTSRLLVDLNRSLGHRAVFSPPIRTLPKDVRDRIVAAYYRPYRTELESVVRERVDAGLTVLHLSCHSFTPELNGQVRRADVGLLYDPARERESAFCQAWQKALQKSLPALCIRRNDPYQGKNDGLTRDFRRIFPADRYLGIEIEINQKWITRNERDWRWLRDGLIVALEGCGEG